MPFALNDATRFISPTKTPEYLAGGKPVVSTPIRDVMHMYGDVGMVKIAATPADFIKAVAATLAQGVNAAQLNQVDRLLAQTSWDRTWSQMRTLLEAVFVETRP
jgi:UDP-galactopyranose mutase